MIRGRTGRRRAAALPSPGEQLPEEASLIAARRGPPQRLEAAGEFGSSPRNVIAARASAMTASRRPGWRARSRAMGSVRAAHRLLIAELKAPIATERLTAAPGRCRSAAPDCHDRATATTIPAMRARAHDAMDREGAPMIAFGCAVTDTRSTALRGAGHPARGRARLRDLLRSRAAGSIFRNYNLLLDRAASARTSRRWCSSTRTPRSSTPTSARRCARRSPTRRSRRRLRRRGRRPQHRLVGGLGHLGLVHPPLRGVGGGEVPGVTWDAQPPYARHRRGRHDRRLRDRRSRRGRCATCASTSRSGQLHGYDFDICLQARAAGKKVITADLRVVHHHSLDLLDDVESWIDATSGSPRSGTASCPASPRRTATGAPRARRAEAEAAAAGSQAAVGRCYQRQRACRPAAELTRQTTSWKPDRWRIRGPLTGLRFVGRCEPAR